MTHFNEQHRKLADLFQEAARQRQLMEPWLDDQKFSDDQNGQIWYAIDTDIAKLYLLPEDMSISRIPQDGISGDGAGPRDGYAEIFPGDNSDESSKTSTIALGQALANHIFFHITGPVPMAVFPPTREELRRVYLGIARDADLEQIKATDELQQLQQIYAGLSGVADDNLRRERLAQNAPNINSILFGLGANRELLRFSYLLDRQRMSGIEDLANNPDAVRLGFPAEAFSEPDQVAEKVSFGLLKEQWFVRLEEEFIQRTGVNQCDIFQRILNQFDSDAELLAWIEWTNKHLKNTRHRLVLLTGSMQLFRVASRHKHDLQGTQPEKSFADLYLRHPRAYLAEPDVLFPSVDEASRSDDQKEHKKKRFLDWLDTFLSHSKGYDPDEGDRKKLEEAARDALETQPNLLGDFQKRWDEYRFSVQLAHPFSDPSLKNTSASHANHQKLQRLFAATQDLDDLRQGLKALVDEQIETNWQACFNMATLAGYSLLFQRMRGTEIPTQNPPPIYFGSLPEARQFIMKLPFLTLIQQAREKNEKLDAVKFHQTLTALRLEDPSCYTYHLGFATLFAMEGAWPVANIQAKRAYIIAERRDDEHITGREAAYMQAVAVRRSAKHVTDLLQVRKHLDTARECLKMDLNRLSPTITTALRFDAEDLALNVSAHLFRIFCDEKIPVELNVLSLQETEALFKELIRSLHDQYSTEDIWVIRHVERKLITNLLMAALLQQKETPESVPSSDYRPWVERLEKSIENKQEDIVPVKVTFLIRAIVLATNWWTTEDKQKRKESAKELNLQLTDQAIKDKFRSMLPYDRRRYQFLRDFVN
ncbi:MAG: hypothetical protein HQL65_00115 [Magnetococcales bacterium]|nr:hypothetical protein [Magnetococcales bacterium]